MSATRKVIHDRVGVGRKHGFGEHRDITVVQNLLTSVGQLPNGSTDGRWGKNTDAALRAFQAVSKLDQTGYVEPNDDTLIALLDQAGILISLPGQKGISGISSLHNWFRSERVTYEREAASGVGTRAYFGLEGNEEYVVQTNHTTFQEGPLKMNCTTYVNLMLSVYFNANAHDDPYDADCSTYGGNQSKHLANDRYGLELVTRSGATPLRYFTDTQQIRDATNPHSVYVIEIDHNRAKGVGHMVLLMNGSVYESTFINGFNSDTCISTPLEQFIERQRHRSKSTIFYLFGPA
jgi:hypothetical protein